MNDNNPIITSNGSAPTAAIDVPIARPDEYSTNYVNELIVSAPGVAANDSDPDGDAISVVLVARSARHVPDGSAGTHSRRRFASPRCRKLPTEQLLLDRPYLVGS